MYIQFFFCVCMFLSVLSSISLKIAKKEDLEEALKNEEEEKRVRMRKEAKRRKLS